MIHLEYNRAEEILNSEKTYEVMYNGQKIWINNIDPRKLSAQVTSLDNEGLEVPLANLQEIGENGLQ